MKYFSIFLPVLLFMMSVQEPISDQQASNYAFSPAGIVTTHLPTITYF